MADSKTDGLVFADGSRLTAADRTRMWFDTFNSVLDGAGANHALFACSQAKDVHGFIPAIYMGPRPKE